MDLLAYTIETWTVDMVMNDHLQVDSFSESVESVKKKEKHTGEAYRAIYSKSSKGWIYVIATRQTK